MQANPNEEQQQQHQRPQVELPPAPVTFPTGPSPPSPDGGGNGWELPKSWRVLTMDWDFQRRWRALRNDLDQRVEERKNRGGGAGLSLNDITTKIQQREEEEVAVEDVDELIDGLARWRLEYDLRAVRQGGVTWEEQKRLVTQNLLPTPHDDKNKNKNKNTTGTLKSLISKKDQRLLTRWVEDDNEDGFLQARSDGKNVPSLDIKTRRVIQAVERMFCSDQALDLERREMAIKLDYLSPEERREWLEQRKTAVFSKPFHNVIAGAGPSMLPTLPEEQRWYSGEPIHYDCDGGGGVVESTLENSNPGHTEEENRHQAAATKLPNEAPPPPPVVKLYQIVTFVGMDANGLAMFMTKRVEGLPGDIVRDIHGNKYIVPDDHFWALGDNAERSYDSRHFGAVPFSNLRFIMDPPGKQRGLLIARHELRQTMVQNPFLWAFSGAAAMVVVAVVRTVHSLATLGRTVARATADMVWFLFKTFWKSRKRS